MRNGHVRVIVDLARDGDPIRGWVDDGRGPPRAFAGWLALSAALDRARGWVAPGTAETRAETVEM